MEKKSVFISYSSKDAIEVGKVIKVLEEAGISYWKAPEMIPIGSNYVKEVPRAISECKVFLLIISEESQKSIWVEKEVDFAINNKKTIVPLNISTAPLSDIFRFYLNNVQSILYYGNENNALRLMRDRILLLLNGDESDGNNQSNNDNKNKSSVIKIDSISENDTETDIDRHEKRRNELKRNMSADGGFGLNPQPVACKYCNGKLKMIITGVYECVNCHKENYDYFRTVKNYLEKAGPSSRLAIEKATGVPRESIDYFIRQERLIAPAGRSFKASCIKCGIGISTGFMCDRCKRIGR